ncbi:helicase-related protein [Sulfurovum mangrovi]|uniref:helicase-related protein n=1 Tax=Sulfurovum mangrovi TaxID=2893889 RepID=UPI001E53B17F|nr:helicase-related protein [Sulfurovum mangrovi]UFH58089.1 helicase [Sulfurovum mangrovi]
MAKKKKKHFIKLNNKIRNYFQGLPFDEGVTMLDDDKLIELVMFLEIPMVKLEREEMIRALRRVWSEEGYKTREQIVSYLTQPYRAVPKGNNAPAHIDKVEKILQLLEGVEHTKDEENRILDAFIDARPAKITKEKVIAKLGYLRLKGRLHSFEKALDVQFNSLNEMTFYESFTFCLKEHDFTKKLLCISDPIPMEKIWEKSDEEIKTILNEIKEKVYAEKKASLDIFLTHLKAYHHPYLTEEEMTKALKGLAPEENLYHAPIAFETVEEILNNISDKYHIFESIDHIVIEKEKNYALFGTTLYYMTSVSYEKTLLYNFIWRGEELPVKDELNDVNDRLLEHFKLAVEETYEEMRDMCGTLKVDEEVIEGFIVRYIEAQVLSSRTLKFKEKSKRRILFHFGEYLKPLLARQKREELLAKTIRDFKRLFPLARELKRKIIFHVGPTNSGKTYSALQALKESTTGYYLAPLRLLALEGYESLKAEGVHASLITGEEEIIDEASTHISSTIEMMNSSVDVDVCVIDEIQMIADRDRGWAWANALIGAPAKTVILTGSSDALEAVTEICEYLEEELVVKHFERKNELAVMKQPTSIKQIEPKTAIVAFSRKEVLSLKQRLSERYRVSVVYGNLSPEVRREEARRFREGESDILVATDAIAMGLNLPIKTILFAKDNKFDGLRRRELLPTEVKQIAGRAGRYGIEEKGYVGALDESILYTIEEAFHAPLPDLKLPFSVMASLEHVLLIGEILETDNILEILGFFADNMEFEGPFVAANIDSMLEIASIVSEYELDLKTRFYLSCAPASISSPYIESVFHRYIRQIEAGRKVLYIPPRDLPAFAQTNDMLLNAEDRVREISLYLWLSFKFPDLFEDTQKAIDARARLNQFIEKSLQKGSFTKTCRKCGKVLDFSYRFSICDECHSKGSRGGYGSSKRGSYRSRRRK